jgi:hypothetical protein
MTTYLDRGGERRTDEALIEEVAKAICGVMELQYPEFTRLKWDRQSFPAKAAYRRRASAALDIIPDRTEAASAFRARLSTPRPNVDEGDGK